MKALNALARLIADWDAEITDRYENTPDLQGLLDQINYAREALSDELKKNSLRTM